MLLAKTPFNPFEKLFSRHCERPLEGKIDQLPLAQVALAVLVCDAWVTLNDARASSDWALNIIQQRWPHIKLASQSQIEVIVGYTGHPQKAKTNMADLLEIMATRTGRDLANFQIEPYETQWGDPAMRIWCLVALHH